MLREYSRTELGAADTLGLHPRERHLAAMDSISAVVESDAFDVKNDVWPRLLVHVGTQEVWKITSVEGLDAEVATFKAERRRELATMLGLGEDVSEEALVTVVDDASTVFRCESACKDGGLRVSVLLDHRCDIHSALGDLEARLADERKSLPARFKVDPDSVSKIQRIYVDACIQPSERFHSKLDNLGTKFVLTGGFVNPPAESLAGGLSALEQMCRREHVLLHPTWRALAWRSIVCAHRSRRAEVQLSAHFSRFASPDDSLVRRLGDEGATAELKIVCMCCYGDRVVCDSNAAILAHEQLVCVRMRNNISTDHGSHPQWFAGGPHSYVPDLAHRRNVMHLLKPAAA